MTLIVIISYVFAAIAAIALIYMYKTYVQPVRQGQLHQTEFEEQTKLIAEIREAITSSILNDNVVVFNAIAKQKMILNSNNRKAIAIFFSIAQFKTILTSLLGTSAHTDDLVTTLVELNVPIAHIGDLPVYVSALLKDAPVFVVGEIKWELEQ